MAGTILVSAALLQEGALLGKELIKIWQEFVGGSVSKSGCIRQHNMYLGNPEADDIVFLNYYRDVPAKIMQRRSEVISWSVEELGEGYTGIITSVSVIDSWTDGTGGVPELVEGGVGKTYVKVKFTSRFSRGYAVRVIVTGLVKKI